MLCYFAIAHFLTYGTEKSASRDLNTACQPSRLFFLFVRELSQWEIEA